MNIPNQIRDRQATAGFTLLEAIVVVSIFSLMGLIALPSMASVSQSLRLESATQEFVGDLTRAHTEAIKRNRSVYVAKTGSSSYTIQYIGDRVLESGATFGTTSPDTIRFASFGSMPTGSADISINLGGKSKTVVVSAGGLLRVR